MKIVQALGWYYPDSIGGTEVYVASLARVLRASGHEVAIAAPSSGRPAPSSYAHEGCDVFRYPVPAAPTRDEAQGRVAVRGAERFHDWLARSSPDVVHLHTFVTGLGRHEVAAARRVARKVIVTTHSSSLGFLCQRGTLMWRGRSLCDGDVDAIRCARCELEHRGAGSATAALLARVGAAVGDHARVLPGRLGTALRMTELIQHNRAQQTEVYDLVDSFVVLTAHAARIVVRNGAPADRIRVNRLGVAQEPTPTPRDDRRRTRAARVRVGYVGRFDPIKGVFDLAEAIQGLAHDLPIEFEFRGPLNTDGDRAMFADLQRRLAGDRRVTFAEQVAPDEIPAVMRSYDVLACPSRCLEGGPTVGLEAIASGTPVIAASAGGLAEVIEDGVNGSLVAPGNVAALRETLQMIAVAPQMIDSWHSRLPRPRTMGDVGADYLTLYAEA